MIQDVIMWGGVIVLAGNVGAVIYKVIKPSMDIKKRVDDLESHSKHDYDTINELKEMNKAQCRMLLAMIDHMIDGNHIDKMKDTREHIINIMTNGKD